MEIGFARAASENQTVQRTAPRRSGEAATVVKDDDLEENGP